MKKCVFIERLEELNLLPKNYNPSFTSFVQYIEKIEFYTQKGQDIKEFHFFNCGDVKQVA